MRKRLLAAFFILVSWPAAATPVNVFPSLGNRLSETDKATLDKVSSYLDSIRTMEGQFVQIGPQGQIDQGRFYIEKPGKIRFEYAPPYPVLIVSDGTTVFVRNSRLHTVDHYSLADTPLQLVLGNDIDLKRRAEIVGVEHQKNALVISARSHSSRAQGNISLVFSEPDLELRQWTVVDAQGLSTTTVLRDVQQDVSLPDKLFAPLVTDRNE